jgi:hypothetical protein
MSTTTAFDQTFSELVATWSQYEDARRNGADFGTRAEARGNLLRLRAKMAAARRDLVH